jgi:hypothetical protein
VFEEVLMRFLGEQSGCVPVALVGWLVTGQWPDSALSFDVSFPRADWARLPGM